MLEYYDFFIYGTAAALVFGKVFFPESDPAAATLLSFATYGVGYVARPIGAFFMGHIGDKYGRKRVLLLTVTLMGVSTFLVGCLPTYDAIGLWAPACWCAAPAAGLLRLGRAGRRQLAQPRARPRPPARVLHQLHAQRHPGRADPRDGRVPADRRAAGGAAADLGLAHSVLAERRRGRRQRADPPPAGGDAGLPAEAEPAGAASRSAVLLRDHSADVLRVALAALASTVSTIFAVWALSSRSTPRLDRTTMLWVSIAANVVALAALPLWAMLADRIGRKPVFIFGAIGSGALMFAYLGGDRERRYPLIFAAAILMSGVVYSAMNGIQPSLYGEMFPTRVRLSASRSAPSRLRDRRLRPDRGRWIAGDGPGGWVPVAAYVLGVEPDRGHRRAHRPRDVPHDAGRDRRAPRADRHRESLR